MKSISIHEVKDKDSGYLASREPISVKRYGKIIGFYVPVQQLAETEVQAALTCLSQTVVEALTQSGWDEEKLSQALNLLLPE